MENHVRAFVPTYVRACVRTSRWKILFTPYLVVELSPSAEIWCVYVTSINDGTQILTFLGIDNNRDFQNSRFFCGEFDYFKSWVAFISILRSIAMVAFLSRIVHSWWSQKECPSRILAMMSVVGILFALDEKVCFRELRSLKKIWSWWSVRNWVLHNVL